jgi:teichuronic acid exporter
VNSPAISSGTLDHALVSGVAWTAIFRWTAQVLSWIGTLYAARLLVPGDYGLVAMATLAIGLARMVEDFGMDALLVQDRSLAGDALARLAGLLLLVAAVLAGAFALAAPLVAGFFGEPRVQLIIVVMSAIFFTDALQVVPRARLQRDLQYRRLGIAQLVQTVATQTALVSAALLGLGYWSLVVNNLAGAMAVTALLVFWSPFAIRWPRELATLARPLLAGWRILASRAAWYGYTSADQTVIGRFLGKDSLGEYSFALTFSSLAQQEVTSVVSKVVPGIFSAVQDRITEMRRYFLQLTAFLALVTFPMAIGLALVADLLVPLLLGPTWTGVVVPLRLLCVYAAFVASQMLLSHVLMWTGQFRVNMWCSILACAVMPIAFYVAVRWGLEGIGWAWVLLFPVCRLSSMPLGPFKSVSWTG